MTDETASTATERAYPLFWLPVAQALLVVTIGALVAMGVAAELPWEPQDYPPAYFGGRLPAVRIASYGAIAMPGLALVSAGVGAALRLKAGESLGAALVTIALALLGFVIGWHFGLDAITQFERFAQP